MTSCIGNSFRVVIRQITLRSIDAIPAFEVLAVEILPVHARPFDGFEFLKICTTRREHTIFVKVLRITVVSLTDIQTEDKAQEWFAALHALVAGFVLFSIVKLQVILYL